MDSLSSLGVFVQVAETGSFVAAGGVLGVSASAIGKSISRLESRLNVRLFHRSTRSLTLTAEGALFLERSRRILAEFEAAEHELSLATQFPRGRLRISLPMVGSLMLPVLSEFMGQYPDIELELNFTDKMVDVIEEGFDAVIRTGEITDSRLNLRKLGDYTKYVVASPDYLAQHGTPQTLEELPQHSCLHYRFSRSGKIEPWPLTFDNPVDLPLSMVCNNLEAQVFFAEQGRGITCLPEFSVREGLSAGRLHSVLEQYVSHRASFNILWPSGGCMTPRLRVLIDFLCEHTFAVDR
ncbi:LysR family transcriptional regulator [Rouxiella badensis]|jgi:DNA-binding transcriptional LysR family regulator|uniref:LysR family transcriptional regulator n=1 Tax=Rouxiella badensis TaxID=1646377 RepID=A0A1X0WII5_9GAMM|nr:LysR family transcriptional regulator [Rouxiella badensis]MCC3703996.1 LysR family transcriptional regulator [Rouxiella badensis]MCC3719017.1 LysR family transcriptional regulator [Rouxiella badensis]MCC3729071.1 LysR family transcriptional regulator [Rouxiella badensis]MCC3733604.1 LysR family transcriptional regulator [Rouxiella badensis]MCC3740622.1 LysR family transcriptional regulator [Rouxiella badensis]